MSQVEENLEPRHDESNDERRFLISESVRGEGGKLYNINGERFVDELLPRDIVADAIFKEMEKEKQVIMNQIWEKGTYISINKIIHETVFKEKFSSACDGRSSQRFVDFFMKRNDNK